MRAIYHNVSLRAPLKPAQGVSDGSTVKQATNTPGKPPETHRIYFNGMHYYAARCMTLIYPPDTSQSPCFSHFTTAPACISVREFCACTKPGGETGSGERARNLLRGREALAGCRGGKP